MKDRILNGLMLLTVAAALGLSLLRGGGKEAGESFAFSALATAAPVQTPHPADAYRLERAQTRQREEALLLALIDGEQTAPETREMAEAQLLQMTKNDEIELAAEAALAAAGCGQGLCVARQGEVTVFFPRQLTSREAALYLNVIQEASGLSGENIRLTGF